jgi:CheY-like chemotaxis protein
VEPTIPLAEAERRKNELLAALAHELRNPLAPIKNAVQLMGMLKLDPEVDELRQMMARQVEELVRLIDDLLDVSQISRGQISLRREIVDLMALIAAAVNTSSRSITENGQKLIINVPDGVKVCVYGDSLRLTQVISNLLNNAARYSAPDSQIELAVVVKDLMAVISVRDHGIGITPEVLPNIFDMFSRADNRPERGSRGLGISLKLVKAIVDLHDGTVVAQSDGVGKGSTFTVRLPMVHDLTSSKIIPAILPQAVSAKSFKVLVVEDMRALRVMTARLLEKLGHEVEVVENGPLALIKLETFKPDVVFSDIAMPGMSGYELAQRIRQRPDCSRVCLVALTGFGQPSDRDKSLEAGFHEHMLKPVDIAALQSLFEKLSRSVAV